MPDQSPALGTTTWLTPEHTTWDATWQRLYEALYARGLSRDVHNSEGWQYMGSTGGAHTFRHRCEKSTNRRVYAYVPYIGGPVEIRVCPPPTQPEAIKAALPLVHLDRNSSPAPSAPSYVWCRTSAQTPRKHAHPNPTSAPKLDVTLGDDADTRIINATWTSGDISAEVSINVATLRRMLALAETYKPGATLTRSACGADDYRGDHDSGL